MTTLELAHAIAQAVLTTQGDEYTVRDMTTDHPTQAVLRVLRETGSWFCAIDQNAQGVTTYQRMPDVQQELFDAQGR
jgi:hypothetical protein